MRYRFIQEHAKEFPVEKMAKVLRVSSSGYYTYLHRNPSRREEENKELIDQIKKIYQEGRCMYGSPKIHAKLCKFGMKCSRKRVANLMRKNGIVAQIRKSWKKTTKQGKGKAAGNLLKQAFTTRHPNEVWVGDITYISTREGWLYLSVVIDLFSRRVVGMSMGERLDTSLIEKALKQALYHRGNCQGLIHHSDRGCQYTSDVFRKLAEENGIILSMSSTGNCYDNAVAESFFHILKTEHVYQKKFSTREEAKRSIFEYVEVFYNRQRVHSFLEYLSPEEYEKNWSKKII